MRCSMRPRLGGSGFGRRRRRRERSARRAGGIYRMVRIYIEMLIGACLLTLTPYLDVFGLDSWWS
jgi:hypothetical protein